MVDCLETKELKTHIRPAIKKKSEKGVAKHIIQIQGYPKKLGGAPKKKNKTQNARERPGRGHPQASPKIRKLTLGARALRTEIASGRGKKAKSAG